MFEVMIEFRDRVGVRFRDMGMCQVSEQRSGFGMGVMVEFRDMFEGQVFGRGSISELGFGIGVSVGVSFRDRGRVGF